MNAPLIEKIFFDVKFSSELHINVNNFLVSIVILIFGFIIAVLLLVFSNHSVVNIRVNAAHTAITLPPHATEPLESFFEVDELNKMKKAYEKGNDQNQMTLVGFLSLSAPMQRLEYSYHLGQVLFLHLCIKLIDTCNYKVQLRINPYGEWPEKGRNTSRNEKYLAAILIWSLATEFKLLPRPLVPDDLTNEDYRLAKKIQDSLSEFRTEFVGPNIDRMPSAKSHKLYDSLLLWRLNPLSQVNEPIKDIASRVQNYYYARKIELSYSEVLAMFYLFLYKFSGTDQEEIAKATLSYINLGKNSIFLECEKNRYFLTAHAALAKISGLEFPSIVYFKGVPSLGLNDKSTYMKGGAKVQEKQLLSLVDLCGSEWKEKISAYLAKSQTELNSLFCGKSTSNTSEFESLVESIAQRLRSSVNRAKSIYS